MALKAIIESLDGLSDNIKSEYKQGEDGKYYLDVDGIDSHPDIGALKRAKDHEKSARQKADKALQDIQDQITALTEERDGLLKGAIPKGDVDRLESSWKQKLATREKELNDQINSMSTHLNTMLVDNVAQTMASKISKSPELILPHIKSRLAAEFVDGKPTTRVLDGEGKPSAMSVADLEKEMFTNPTFAPIIIGSKASGSGASGGSGGSGAPGKLDYSKATPKEIAAHIKQTKQAAGG